MSALLACGGSHGHTPPSLDKALVAAMGAADHVQTPWRCAAADGPKLAAEQLPNDWQTADHSLRHGAKSELSIGVVADAGGAAPQTLAALGRLRAQLDAAHVDLVVALGGMGGAQPALEATLGVLADHAPWPVVALPGELESMSAQVAAITALRARHEVVLDGRLVRWIELPGITLGTVPGAGDLARLVAGTDGCAWQLADITGLYGELAARSGLRIAALAEAPRELVDGEATGEVELTPGQPIDLVLHGPTHPAPSPAQSGGRDGAHVALSPGTSDATTRLPETRKPSAGLLVIHGTAWTWRPLVDH